jgi:iron complex outermembrane receptor protein
MAYTELAYRPETGFYATWDLHWVGRFYTNNANSTINPAYTVSNLRFGERYNLGKVAVGPFFGINNLFDEKYNENVRVNAFGGRYFEPAPRRNIYGGVTVRYNF